ncbi:MAG: hypothetical protein V4669_08450 [Pseudomonadota bacterium]
MNQPVMQAAPTAHDIRVAFERIESDALQRESAFERRALRNYLLHMLLAVSQRHDELFEFDTAAQEPDYVFFDSGKRVQGRQAIAAFHREQAANNASLCVPVDQRVAMGAWGFAAEVTMYQYLPDGTLHRTPSALVWRCDDKGRMKSLRFYPAAKHDTVRLAGTPVTTSDLAAELAPLVERLRQMK